MKKKIETTVKRTTFGFKPELYEKFQKITHVQNSCPNRVVAKFMEMYVSNHQKDLELYENLQKEKQSD